MDINRIIITPEILTLIAEIDEFKGSWRSLKTLAPEKLATLKKVATIESIGSSTRIEGVKMSDQQIETLLSNLDKHSFTTRDEQEVAGYAEVMDILFQSWDTIPITENYIKQLHSILLKYSPKDERHRGNYKTIENHIEAFNEEGKSLGVIFATASAFETPLKMENLVFWLRQEIEEKRLHPLLIIGIFIVNFLAIHPFQDGNGRISRILTTLLLLKSGYIYVPYSSLENIIEENKDSYYLALRRTQQSIKNNNSDYLTWLLFFLKSLKKQKDKLAKKLERELICLTSLPELSVQILELAKDYGRISTKDIEQYTKASRSTIKARLNELVKQEKIYRYGKGRSTWYSL
jgi:Fic family protein